MNHGEIFARTTQMREAASALRSSSARIRESIDVVDFEIRALGADRYTSVAAEEFRAQYNRVTPILREVAHKLAIFQERLSLAADEIDLAARPTT